MVLAVFGIFAVIFALLLLFQRTLYGSAMCLLLVLLQVAAMFFAMGAQLLGLMQVLVYAGAIMVLIVVAVMSAPPKLLKLWAGYEAPPAAATLVLAMLGAEFALVLFAGSPLPGGEPSLSAARLEREMAAFLFGPGALVTEVVGLLVLVASLSVVGRKEA
ncbi:MAG: NADH-quinone oxidoreductase subunit J [Elusimicrobia bacterium]|nr:NADH-quinone oxidoreductase subunit J [Elusimicrobiota bacterium]